MDCFLSVCPGASPTGTARAHSSLELVSARREQVVTICSLSNPRS